MALRVASAALLRSSFVAGRMATRSVEMGPRITALWHASHSFCSHPDFQPTRNIQEDNKNDVQDKLKKLVTDNKVVLFMKGSPDMPQCGFSRAVAQALQKENFQDYAYVDVLKYPEVREGVKKFSDWPTVPQLYVKGEFMGGCDIVVQMHKDGELKETLAQK